MKKRLVPALLTLSAIGAASIAVHEGYRSMAYDDGTGRATIGYGTTAGVKPGQKTDPVRAVVLLAEHASQVETALRGCIGEVPLYQHEWDAYVSLAYNIGQGAFCRSSIVPLLRAQPPDYAGACAQIKRWTMAGGRQMPGLVKRREAEYRLCMGDAGHGR